jgi:hypothetical protein
MSYPEETRRRSRASRTASPFPCSTAVVGGRRSKQLFFRRKNRQSGEAAQGLLDKKSGQNIGRVF